MNELSLFTGAGGGLLGSRLLGWNTVLAVEIEKYPREVLLQRQREGQLNRFPIWDDIKTFRAEEWAGKIDVVSGGFPCQAFSKATRGNSTASNLWPEMLRVVVECRPRFVFAENVAKEAIEQAGLDLWQQGYDFVYAKISAADLGADHHRSRWWLLAYSNLHSKLCLQEYAEASVLPKFRSGVWETEPEEFRVPDGVACRMDRLKAVGNGQIPAMVVKAWEVLTTAIVKET